MVPAPVAKKIDLVRRSCMQAGVRSLWVFGSAVRGGWRAGSSDIDFLVELSPHASRAEQFFGLYRALSELFDERIDLVSIDGVKNPYFLAELVDTRVPLYVAA